MPSPQIIAYRKSKRTVSEGMYDSVLESSPTSPQQQSLIPSCMWMSFTRIPSLDMQQ